MRYKVRGNNQYAKKTNLHYLLNFGVAFIILAVFVNIPKFFPPEAQADLISPVPDSSAQSQMVEEASNSASLEDVVSNPDSEKAELVEKVEDYIRTIFGHKDAKIAIAVMKNECNPQNKAWPKCYYRTEFEKSVGIFQINLESTKHWIHAYKVPGETIDEKVEWLKDPYHNTLVAYKIFKSSGWTAWSAYTNKNYLKDL